MNLADLRTELLARGFDYLDAPLHPRPNQYLNRAYHAICDAYEWPFLEADAVGTAPLTIPDLRAVLGVLDTTHEVKLRYIDRRRLLDIDPGIGHEGSPALWFQSAQDQLSVYPLNTSASITVRYVKVPEDLEVDTDVPIIPARFHMLIVDQAVVYAYEDSDNLEAGAGAQATVDRRLEEMRLALLHPNLDSHDYIASTVDHQMWPW
jgi:hypothetical protein